MSSGLSPRSAAVFAVVLIPLAAEAAIRPGAEMGLNVSTLVYDQQLDFWSSDWRPSFTGGILVKVPIGERELSLVPGLRYVDQGNRVGFVATTPIGTAVTGEFRVSQKYLALPVLLRYGAFPKRNWFVTLGPELAYLVSAHVTTQAATAPGLTSEGDILDEMERWNLSIGGGVGLEFPIQAHSGTVQLRYWEGLVGTAKEQKWISDWRTRNVEFLIGYCW